MSVKQWSRRRLLAHAAVAPFAAGACASSSGSADEGRRISAVAFDAFPVFDPRPILAAANALDRQEGRTPLAREWFQALFARTWLLAAAGRAGGFLDVARDTLAEVTRRRGIAADELDRIVERIVDRFATLEVWPDAARGLAELRRRGLQIVFLSNLPSSCLASSLGAADLGDAFDAIFSTELVQTFKPSPRAYAIGTDRLGLAPEEILFVAFAEWDAAGASWYGYPTFWMNRLGVARAGLAGSRQAEGTSFSDLVASVSR